MDWTSPLSAALPIRPCIMVHFGCLVKPICYIPNKNIYTIQYIKMHYLPPDSPISPLLGQ